MTAQDPLRERIIDTALSIAEQRSWEALRLHDVSNALAITLDDIRAYFREKEEIVDAWFDRADRAMLQMAARPDIAALASLPRLQGLLMAWLGVLRPHKKVARQMILNKLEPGHFHYQFAGLLRVSRTVQWWREAAGRDATLPRRAFEETALTGIYLTTFAYWMTDDSEGDNRTAAYLRRMLAFAARAERMLGRAGESR